MNSYVGQRIMQVTCNFKYLFILYNFVRARADQAEKRQRKCKTKSNGKRIKVGA